MQVTRHTVQDIAEKYPESARDMAARGIAASVLLESPKVYTIALEDIHGNLMLINGSHALLVRYQRQQEGSKAHV